MITNILKPSPVTYAQDAHGNTVVTTTTPATVKEAVQVVRVGAVDQRAVNTSGDPIVLPVSHVVDPGVATHTVQPRQVPLDAALESLKEPPARPQVIL
jgi:hypothetical protein